MLWRALKHVKHGCYIDVGAQHPVIDSVSKAFYELGWRGVHVEPVQHYVNLLRQDRPDETVLQLALSDTEGTLELNIIPETGLSTGVESYAQRHHAELGFSFQKVTVPVTTLKNATSQLAGKDVHWLKIDVEGLEIQVLKGWDSAVLRPWIIVLEATIPNTMETNHAGWEPILTAANYRFAYFDGLNRFYVAQEHAELLPSFAAPPNVFDEVVLTRNSPMCREFAASLAQLAQQLAQQEQRARAASAQLQTTVRQLDATTARAALAEERIAHLECELNSVLGSRSWYITRPLRWLNRNVHSPRQAPR